MQEKLSKAPDLFQRFGRLLRETNRKPSSARVHQLRTTARRLESALEPAIGSIPRRSAKLLKQLAKLRKRAGKVRDLDVQLAALKTVNIGHEQKLQSELAAELEAARYKRAEKLLKLLDSKSRSRIQKRLRQAQTKPRNATATAERKYELRAARALALLLAKASTAGAFTPESLHRFRLQCKRARYLFELAPQSERTTYFIEQLRSVQDSVGDWHDWLMLTDSARERLTGHSALLAALENTTRAKFAEAVRCVKAVLPELHYQRTVPHRKPAARAAEPASGARAHAANA
jgi:CHAD domain-containing protein